jgi:HlyD family secretion protein
MKRPVFSAILALAMISFAGWSIASKYSPRQVAAPPIEAPTNPFDHDVAGVGIVEPASEIISLAIERGGVVSRVDVVAGQTVKAGAPLFSIDRRNYEAAVAQAEASAAAQEAAIASITQNMLLQQELIRQAQANLDSAEAERTSRLAGSQALCRSYSRWLQAGVLANPLMTMGSADPLHVRADVDEADSWRIDAKGPAIARLRGNPAISAPLNFVRFEPYVLPKRSLSGDNTERVDTRVLQVIYAFAPKDFPAFVGQQVDIFIKAPARAEVLGRVAMDAHNHSTADVTQRVAADLKE